MANRRPLVNVNGVVQELPASDYIFGNLTMAQVVGDGINNTFFVDHNFGTKNVSVIVYRNSDPWDEVIAGITRPTDNRVGIYFDDTFPAANSFVVVVKN